MVISIFFWLWLLPPVFFRFFAAGSGLWIEAVVWRRAQIHLRFHVT
jgi:hypothetical protein